MRRLLSFALLWVSACAQTSVPPTPTGTATASTPPTTVASAAAVAKLPVVVEDCSAPQVGFAPLCESFQLIQEWHVDRPIDPGHLADAAIEGLVGFETDQAAPLPRTLFCAIPDQAFTPLCDTLAGRMEQEGLPVEPALEATVLAMADRGLDPFSYYLPPDQVGSFRANGVVEGVGLLLDAADAAGSRCAVVGPACPLRVVFVLDGNPGADAGLQAGDVIVTVDGVPVEGAGFVETATLIAGNEVGVVTLGVKRAGAELTVTVRRAPLDVPTVEVGTPRAGVGYLRIPDFEADVPALVRDALEDLSGRGVTRLVLDLRDNPGGLVEAMMEVADELMAGTVLEASSPGETVVYEAPDGGLAENMDVAVLVNGGTASAAEILAAALHDLRGARILGEGTYGKDVLQIPFPLGNGGELHIAAARWISPGGTSVGGTGLTPDVTVPLPATMSTDQLATLAFE